jgi:hypothetical protein
MKGIVMKRQIAILIPALSAVFLPLLAARGAAALPCGTPATIACGETVQGTLSTSSCQFADGTYYDAYSFIGYAGQTAVLQMSSPTLAPAIALENPAGGIELYAGSDLTETIFLNQALNETSGSWSALAYTSQARTTGKYALALSCINGSATCAGGANALCLSQGRFLITATYDGGASGAGAATAVPLSGDTGYLWFFSAANVEVVAKIVDGCALNGRYWFFAGGLTNVAAAITVTDTQTGARRTYKNPANTTFVPIQDTSAFSTCNQ